MRQRQLVAVEHDVAVEQQVEVERARRVRRYGRSRPWRASIACSARSSSSGASAVRSARDRVEVVAAGARRAAPMRRATSARPASSPAAPRARRRRRSSCRARSPRLAPRPMKASRCDRRIGAAIAALSSACRRRRPDGGAGAGACAAPWRRPRRAVVGRRCRRSSRPVVGARAARLRAEARRVAPAIGRRAAGSRFTRRGAARLAHRLEQRVALVVARLEQRFPPLGQLRIDLADVGAQAQEVEAGAKARLLDQASAPSCRRAARSAAASSRSRACRRPACRGRRCRRCARRTRRRSPPAAPGTAARPRAWRCFQPSRTSCHSMQASRKLGATGLPSPTRRSVSASARLHELLAAVVALRLVEHHVEHREDAAVQAQLASARRCVASAWPVCSSLIISSNSARAAARCRAAPPSP